MCECVHVRACVGVWTLVHHGGRGIRTGRVRRGGKLCWEGRAGARLQEYALFASHARLCPVIGLSREPWGTVPERSSGRLEAGTLPTWVPAPAPPPPHRRGIGLSKGPGGPTAPWPPRQLPCSPPITPQLAPAPPRGPLPSAEPCRGWAAGIGVIHGSPSPSPSRLLPASGRRHQAPGPRPRGG